MTNSLCLFLLLGGLAAFPPAHVAVAPQVEEIDGVPAGGEYVPPNVIVIVIDDLGIDQLGCYDDLNHYDCPYPYARTPNIDRLVDLGVRFTQARTMPLCSPTRAAFQSGMYPRRTGCGSIVDPLGATNTFSEFGVSPAPAVNSVAHELDLLGYETGMFGKLHLHQDLACGGPGPPGTGDAYAHSVLGYDHYEGILRNPDNDPQPLPDDASLRPWAFSYYYWVTANATTLMREVVCSCPPCPTTTDQCTPVGCTAMDCTSCYQGEYATRKQRLAIQSWIQGQQEPYFALWNMNDIHGPTQWPPALSGLPDEEGHYFGAEPPIDYGNTRLRAKLEYVDSSIGMLLANVDMSNTILIVVGDNGTQGGGPQAIQDDEPGYPMGHPDYPYDPSPCSPPGGGPEFSWAPYQTSHLKGSSYEGGVRVPLIVAGAGVESPGRSSDALVDIVDFYETLRELATGPGYVAPVPCSPTVGMPCSDSISFACVLSNSCSAGSHARQYSHGGLFWPNSYPAAPDVVDPNGRDTNEYFLRRDPSGRLWKIVRQYDLDAQGACYSDELFLLNTDPLEANPLPLSSAYTSVKADFDAMFPPHFTNVCN